MNLINKTNEDLVKVLGTMVARDKRAELLLNRAVQTIYQITQGEPGRRSSSLIDEIHEFLGFDEE